MKNCYNSYKVILKAMMVLLLFGAVVNVYGVPYTVYGNVYNSDDTEPATGDITITAYLKKNPVSTHIFSNDDASLWGFDIDSVWGYFPGGEGGPTNVNPGDSLIIDFVNTNASSAYFGESGQIRDAVEGVSSDQRFGAIDFSLPVEITSFKAKYENQMVNVSWQTQSEIDNLGFNIYRSIDNNTNYEKLNYRIVAGSGTTIQRKDYTFTDNSVQPGKTYFYRLESVDVNGTEHHHGEVFVVIFDNNTVPESHQLYQNYPNPFNPTTTINYSLADESYTHLSVYNIVGDFVADLVNENQTSGSYSVNWDGTKYNGDKVSTGIYFYKLETNQTTLVRKMILSK